MSDRDAFARDAEQRFRASLTEDQAWVENLVDRLWHASTDDIAFDSDYDEVRAKGWYRLAVSEVCLALLDLPDHDDATAARLLKKLTS